MMLQRATSLALRRGAAAARAPRRSCASTCSSASSRGRFSAATPAGRARRWVRAAGLSGVAYGGLSLSAGWVVRADGAAAETVPPFDPNSSRFDQSTYGGRLQQIFVQLDPMKLFVSGADIDAAVALIKAFRAGTHSPSTTDAQLWAAKELIECRIHPDTGELTPTFFCFAAYTPMQPPIIVGLLTASSPMAVAFWQWYNQSYNAAVFYANKSGQKRKEKCSHLFPTTFRTKKMIVLPRQAQEHKRSTNTARESTHKKEHRMFSRSLLSDEQRRDLRCLLRGGNGRSQRWPRHTRPRCVT